MSNDILQAYFNIPLEMRQIPSWCLWRYEDIGAAKPTKIPYQPNGELANVNDPTTWSIFDAVLNSRFNFSGIGFVFSDNDPYTFIDLDDPSNDPASIDRQLKIFNEFDSYSEISPSGKGLHIIIKGKFLGNGRRRSNIEVYCRQRYATMTGNVYKDLPINEHQDKLKMLYEQMGHGPNNITFTGNEPQKLEDKEIIDTALKAINGEKFSKLLYGHWQELYQSQSEADLAFIDIIAFYTQNKDQITRIFRQSPLGARPKAKRNDYIDRMVLRSFDKMLPKIDIDGFKIAAEEQFNGYKHITSHNSNSVGNIDSSNSKQIAGSSNGKSSDFESDNKGSIPLPAATFTLTPPPGLMGEIAKFIYDSSPRQVPEIAIAGAIGLMAGICGRAYNISATGLNQYVILIASTGSGKEAMASGISKLINSVSMQVPTVKGFIGPGQIASGQALARYIHNNPCFVSVLGEFGIRLQSMSDPRANGPEKNLLANMLDLFNKSGYHQSYQPTIYSDKDKNIPTTRAPSFSILAESTPETFYQVLNEDMVLAGLLPRFLIIEYRGMVPYLNENAANVQPWLSLIDQFSSLVAQCEMIMHGNKVIDVRADDKADTMLRTFQRQCTDKVNSEDKDFMKHLWSRAHMKSLKIAALIAVGVNSIDPVVTTEYVMWAINLVTNDIRLLSSRFEQGQIGAHTGEIKQIEEMKRVVKEYYEKEGIEAKYKIPTNLYVDKVLVGQYLNRRLIAQKAFKDDRMGANIAIKRSIQTLIDQDILREIPAVQLMEKYGTRQKAYVVSNFKALGD